MNQILASMSLAICVTACSSSISSSAPGANDAGSDGGTVADAGSHDSGAGDVAAEGGGEGGVGTGSGSITGTYGTQTIAPIVAAYWIGKPGNPAESGGGPFIYLFSEAITCAELSQGSGWVTSIASGTQVLELIVGTTTTGTAVQAAPHAAPGALEANYAIAPSATESRATSGSVTLTAYVPGSSVDAMVNVTFPSGSAQGTFHAVWCASGNEF
jgi:hypothetical protein